MLFVADQIPTELQSIVEFLNEQMDSAEVLAVKIKQHMGDELKTLVPRVTHMCKFNLNHYPQDHPLMTIILE